MSDVICYTASMQIKTDTVTQQARSVYLDILLNKTEPILYEDDQWFVLFAKTPCNEGHLLVIPKIKESDFFRLPGTVLDRGFRIATQLSTLLSEVYQPPRVGVFIKGFTNDDHAHIHVTPLYDTTDMNVGPSHPRPPLPVEQMWVIAKKLQAKIHEQLK